jgi:hypothetical protein
MAAFEGCWIYSSAFPAAAPLTPVRVVSRLHVARRVAPSGADDSVFDRFLLLNSVFVSDPTKMCYLLEKDRDVFSARFSWRMVARHTG